jgi:hypothetical protein
MSTVVAEGVQNVRGNKALLTSTNAVLKSGELGYITDTDRAFIGDGSTTGENRPVFHDSEHEGYIQRLNNCYAGKLLTVNPQNAAEITSAGNIWDWLVARRTAGNFENINCHDKLQFDISAGTVTDVGNSSGYTGTYSHTIPAQTVTAEVVGINTYKGYGDGGHEVGNHIDFRCTVKVNVSPNVIWQRSNNNNGTSENPNPYMSSVVRAFLNGINNYSTNAYNSIAHGADFSSGGLFQLCPAKMQSACRTKRLYVGTRYSATQLLNQDTAGAWVDLDKFFLFFERELFGCAINSASKDSYGCDRSTMGTHPYPALQDNAGSLKTAGRVNSWGASVASGSTERACGLNGDGIAGANYCTDPGFSVVFGFRI